MKSLEICKGTNNYNNFKAIDKLNKLQNTSVHTNTPVLTIPKTSASLVNTVAKEPKERPRIAAKQIPVTNPIWKNMPHQVLKQNLSNFVCIRHSEYNGEA
jgi:hypothetical protein